MTARPTPRGGAGHTPEPVGAIVGRVVARVLWRAEHPCPACERRTDDRLCAACQREIDRTYHDLPGAEGPTP